MLFCSVPLSQDLHMFTNPKLSEPGYLDFLKLLLGFPGRSVLKNPPANAGVAREVGSIPGSGRPPGVGNGNLLQYSCLENYYRGVID